MIELKQSGPIKINEYMWFYRNKRSIELVHEIRVDGRYIRTDQVRIPLRKILNAMRGETDD